ncbi:MAG: nucleotidyltransferase [Firmicutes bacterium]|nr:nucleotidyltransferase [Bacillota bacterium]
MANDLRLQFSKFLQLLADSLDITEKRYEQAEERYRSLGDWLGRKESGVVTFSPTIYPQGSFLLGTVIKPVSNAEEYDIDLVCEVKLKKEHYTQKQLKELIGQEIKAYTKANNMNSHPEEGRRCWTINYADGAQFHMDILPAVPDGDSFKVLLESRGFSNHWSVQGIAITDNKLPNYDSLDTDWPRSNPRGFADWFKTQMKTQFDARRMIFAESIKARIEDIPDYKIKTPLQRAIQILKRHRDIMFTADQDDKPISIIITTLAAHAYKNESELVDALINIVRAMPSYIETKEGVKWVSNPVNPLENFADKWKEHPQREKNFIRWLKQVQTDISQALEGKGKHNITMPLKISFGEASINEALKSFSVTNEKTFVPVIETNRTPSKFDVPYREKLKWPFSRQCNVTVSGCYKYNGLWQSFENDCRPLPKDCDLGFLAKTDVPQPYKVFWQVVNTGYQAKQLNQLRGGIFSANNDGSIGLAHSETTRYTGMHWIECFIVKDGVCVAKSGEFVVNIV